MRRDLSGTVLHHRGNTSWMASVTSDMHVRFVYQPRLGEHLYSSCTMLVDDVLLRIVGIGPLRLALPTRQ